MLPAIIGLRKPIRSTIRPVAIESSAGPMPKIAINEPFIAGENSRTWSE